METAWTGESCFTASESAKLVARLAREGVKVESVRGTWTHFTSWKSEQGRKDGEEKLRELLGGVGPKGGEGGKVVESGRSNTLLSIGVLSDGGGIVIGDLQECDLKGNAWINIAMESLLLLGTNEIVFIANMTLRQVPTHKHTTSVPATYHHGPQKPQVSPTYAAFSHPLPASSVAAASPLPSPMPYLKIPPLSEMCYTIA